VYIASANNSFSASQFAEIPLAPASGRSPPAPKQPRSPTTPTTQRQRRAEYNRAELKRQLAEAKARLERYEAEGRDRNGKRKGKFYESPPPASKSCTPEPDTPPLYTPKSGVLGIAGRAALALPVRCAAPNPPSPGTTSPRWSPSCEEPPLSSVKSVCEELCESERCNNTKDTRHGKTKWRKNCSVCIARGGPPLRSSPSEQIKRSGISSKRARENDDDSKFLKGKMQGEQQRKRLKKEKKLSSGDIADELDNMLSTTATKPRKPAPSVRAKKIVNQVPVDSSEGSESELTAIDEESGEEQDDSE
jgi:hypothetical protein